MSGIDHTFAVCAHMESCFLEECLASLEAQSMKRSKIILCTSTPNAAIEKAAAAHGLEVFVNPVQEGIASDWNFAYRCADTPYVTLAHQDDIYEPDYAARILEGLDRSPDTLIAFTGYYEIQKGQKVYAEQFLNLRLKRLLLQPLRNQTLQKSRWVRRRILSLADPIGCPAVTYVKANLPDPVFTGPLSCTLDWYAWERISRLKGRFLYVDSPLMGHRIHAASTSTATIGKDCGRKSEDLEVMKLFWPGPMAKAVNNLYSLSQRCRGKE